MFALAAILLQPAAAAIDPAHALNITVYHVNEKSFGAVPVNMNTAVREPRRTHAHASEPAPPCVCARPAAHPTLRRGTCVWCVPRHTTCAQDSVGDMFFDLLEVLPYPLACPNGTHTSYPKNRGPNPCTNPEAAGASLMVNKLTLEVDSRFSGCELRWACPMPLLLSASVPVPPLSVALCLSACASLFLSPSTTLSLSV